jgi:hypothetical protein
MTSYVCASVAIRFLERIILSLIALELPRAKPGPFRSFISVLPDTFSSDFTKLFELGL